MQINLKYNTLAKGKTFITTREKGCSGELMQLISGIGGQLLELPMIETSMIDHEENKSIMTNGLNKYDWIIFTSANGVRFFFEFLDLVQKSKNIFESLKKAVIGEKTAQKLNHFGIEPNYISTGKNSENFVNELKELFQNSRPNILFPTSQLAGDTIEKGLDGKANVKRLDLYTTTLPESIDLKLVSYISKDTYELIYFYSPSAVNNFCKATSDKIDLNKIHSACIGTTTYKACISNGIIPLYTAERPDSKSMFDATVDYLKLKTVN